MAIGRGEDMKIIVCGGGDLTIKYSMEYDIVCGWDKSVSPCLLRIELFRVWRGKWTLCDIQVLKLRLYVAIWP